MRKYPAGGVVVGIVQAAEAFTVYRNQGVVGQTNVVVTFVELLWAVVSLVVLIRVKHRPTRVLAAVFVLYNIAGWILSADVDTSTLPVVIPLRYALIAGVFGVVYALWSLWIARQPDE